MGRGPGPRPGEHRQLGHGPPKTSIWVGQARAGWGGAAGQVPGPGRGIWAPAATHGVGARDSRVMTRSWGIDTFTGQVGASLAPRCRLPGPDLPINPPPSGKGAGGHLGSWGPEGEQGRGASLLALGLLGQRGQSQPQGTREARCFLLLPHTWPQHPRHPPPAPEAGVSDAGEGCRWRPARRVPPGAGGDHGGQREGETGRERSRTRRGLTPTLGAGTSGTPEGRGRSARGAEAARPWLQPFPALIVLGENRTLSRSHCPAPPALLPGGSGRMLGNKSEPETRRDRDAKRHRDRYKGEGVRQKHALKPLCARRPGALWEP